MSTRKLLIGIFIIIILASAGYAWMGGFSKPEIKRITTSEIYIAGKQYQGSVKDDKFGKLFMQAGKLVEEKKLAGVPGSIFYNDPEKHQDSINAFIGVILSDPKAALPEDYQLITIPAGKKAVQGNINAHYLLAPSRIYPEIFSFAKENNLTLQDFFVERFPDTHHAEVLVLEKDK